MYNQPNPQKTLTTVMCVLSYIGVLCLIPFLTQRLDAFVQFHAKQGFNLFILEAIVFVACFVLKLFPFIGFIGNLLYSLSSLLFFGTCHLWYSGIMPGRMEETPDCECHSIYKIKFSY